jgi:hypothetical protein
VVLFLPGGLVSLPGKLSALYKKRKSSRPDPFDVEPRPGQGAEATSPLKP